MAVINMYMTAVHYFSSYQILFGRRRTRRKQSFLLFEFNLSRNFENVAVFFARTTSSSTVHALCFKYMRHRQTVDKATAKSVVGCWKLFPSIKFWLQLVFASITLPRTLTDTE